MWRRVQATETSHLAHAIASGCPNASAAAPMPRSRSARRCGGKCKPISRPTRSAVAVQVAASSASSRRSATLERLLQDCVFARREKVVEIVHQHQALWRTDDAMDVFEAGHEGIGSDQ